MPVFLVESYLPRSANAFGKASESAREAADLAAQQGVVVRYLRTTLIPADEICLHLFEAASVADVEAAAARAGLICDRIVEALTEGLPAYPPTSARDAKKTVGGGPPGVGAGVHIAAAARMPSHLLCAVSSAVCRLPRWSAPAPALW